MPTTELKTRFRTTGPHAPELLLDILIKPRGSGNRAFAQGLAQQFRQDPRMRPHVRRVVAGVSRVTVSLVASPELMRVVWNWNKSADLSGMFMPSPAPA